MNGLTAAHIGAEERLRAQIVAAVALAWRRLPDYSDGGAESFTARIVPVVLAAQRSSATLTAAYLARRLGVPTLRPDFAAATGAAVRAGVDPVEVYRRPFVTVWTALSNGAAPPAALSAGLARATSTAAMDVQLAMRSTVAELTDREQRIDGYSRVPDAGACALCVLASTQRYGSGDLMPIHNHCGCGVDPIIDGRAPTEPEADRIAAAAETGVEPVVHTHGELGPVLGKAGDAFAAL